MKEKGGTQRAEICLGMLCNNKCVFCMSTERRDKKEPWMPLAQVRSELKHYRDKGCRWLGFLGGEPTAHPDILECVRCAQGLGYTRIALCTNGTRLSNPAFCRDLVLAGVTRFTLSVHSHRAEVEDGLITGVPGNLARKVAALENLAALQREGLLQENISLNPVLCGPNYREMEDYIAFFSKLGVWDIRFNTIWPNGRVILDKAWAPPFRKVVPEIVRTLLRNEKRPRMRLTFGGVPKCTLRFARLSDRLLRYLAAKYLDEGGFDPANDVSAPREDGKKPGRFVWQEQKKNNLKVMPPGCGTCRYLAGCDGVWKTYEGLYGFGEFEAMP